MSKSMFPVRVLIAGVPRSGSTWCFNAVRLLVERSGVSTHSAWYADYEAEHDAEWHIIKAHQPDQVEFEPSITITTARDVSECVASLIRMGWVVDAPQDILNAAKAHTALYEYWNARSACEIQFELIGRNPETAVRQLAKAMRIAETYVEDVAAVLSSIEPPSEGAYSRETLLHPDHIGDGRESAARVARVREILAESA